MIQEKDDSSRGPERYNILIPVILLTTVILPFLLLPLTARATCAIIDHRDNSTLMYTHVYSEPYGLQSLSYLIIPPVVIFTSLVSLAALTKLSLATWGRSFDPPRTPWALVMMLDGIFKILITLTIPVEMVNQCVRYTKYEPDSEPTMYIVLNLSILLSQLVLVALILVVNGGATFTIGRSHYRTGKKERISHEGVELDDNIFAN